MATYGYFDYNETDCNSLSNPIFLFITIKYCSLFISTYLFQLFIVKMIIFANLKDLSEHFFIKIEFQIRLRLFILNITFYHYPLELIFSFQLAYWSYYIIVYHSSLCK